MDRVIAGGTLRMPGILLKDRELLIVIDCEDSGTGLGTMNILLIGGNLEGAQGADPDDLPPVTAHRFRSSLHERHKVAGAR